MACVALAALACSKYEDKKNVHITAYGLTVEYRGEGAANYSLLQDDGAILYIEKNAWPHEEVAPGQRVKFKYEIIDSPSETRTMASGEVHDIALYYITMVPEWDPVPLSFILEDEEHRQDSIGNDPLAGISRLFFSGDYVNVEYSYWKKEIKPHNMNLVVDDMQAVEGEVRVEIRHNANGDMPGSSMAGFERKYRDVSFNIRSLVPPGENSVKIKFVWKESGKSKPVEKTGVFTLDSGAGKPIVGSVESYQPGSF